MGISYEDMGASQSNQSNFFGLKDEFRMDQVKLNIPAASAVNPASIPKLDIHAMPRIDENDSRLVGPS